MLIPRPTRVEQLGGLGAAAGNEPDLELLPVGPPEGYRLDTTGPSPRIRAQDAAGVAWALTTLGRLPVTAGRLPAVVIEDRPRYPWRGLQVDAVGGGLDAAALLEILDAIAELKLNRLHVRLADVERSSLELEGWTPSAPTITRADYRRIAEHAQQRHVVLVPGLELLDGPLPEETAGAVLREVAELTPGPWLHLGAATNAQADSARVARMLRLAIRYGKQPIGGHGIGRFAELPTWSVGHYRGPLEPTAADAEQLRAVVEQDGWAICSPATLTDLAAGGERVVDAAAWDPAVLVPGVGEDRILGIEAVLEAPGALPELRAAWPQLSALAELMWSDAAPPSRPRAPAPPPANRD